MRCATTDRLRWPRRQRKTPEFSGESGLVNASNVLFEPGYLYQASAMVTGSRLLSSSSRILLRSSPPPYPVRLPLAPITR
jgi:hypothetical protein